MDQNIDLHIFFLIAVDSTGHQVLMVPKERADAKTFSSQKALWDNVGMIKLEEAEDVEIFRWLTSRADADLGCTPDPMPGQTIEEFRMRGRRAAVKTWYPDPNGPLCLSVYHSVK